MVDHKHLDPASLRFQSQSKLLLDRRKERSGTPTSRLPSSPRGFAGLRLHRPLLAGVRRLKGSAAPLRCGNPAALDSASGRYERLLLLAESEVDAELVREALPMTFATPSASAPASNGPLASRMEAFEHATIRAELERTRYNMTETAKALDLERSHLYKKCAQLGIQVKQLRHTES